MLVAKACHAIGDPRFAVASKSCQMLLHAFGCGGIEGRQIRREQLLNRRHVEVRQDESWEIVGSRDCSLLASRSQSTVSGLDCRVEIRPVRQGAKGVDAELAAGARGYGIRLGAQGTIVLFDLRHLHLEGTVEHHTLAAEDELVEFLPVIEIDGKARADVGVDEMIVENGDARK